MGLGQNPRDDGQKQPDGELQTVRAESSQGDRKKKAKCRSGSWKGNYIPIITFSGVMRAQTGLSSVEKGVGDSSVKTKSITNFWRRLTVKGQQAGVINGRTKPWLFTRWTIKTHHGWAHGLCISSSSLPRELPQQRQNPERHPGQLTLLYSPTWNQWPSPKGGSTVSWQLGLGKRF